VDFCLQDEVTINYNKLHADPQQGKTLDIVLKKVKHRLVESMSTATADALGLSRAILCNDSLVKKLEELEQTEMMYRGLVEHAKRVLKAFFDLLQVYKGIHNSETIQVPRSVVIELRPSFSIPKKYKRIRYLGNWVCFCPQVRGGESLCWFL
jgi:hypothetical protein